MQPQKQADHRRGKGPDKGKAPVYAQDRKTGLADARPRTLPVAALVHHEDARAFAKESGVHGNDDDRQRATKRHDHAPGNLRVAQGVDIMHERHARRGKCRNGIEERVEPRAERAGQEQRHRTDDADDNPAKTHEEQRSTPVKPACLEEAQR